MGARPGNWRQEYVIPVFKNEKNVNSKKLEGNGSSIPSPIITHIL
jgi:hypothetical protein